MFSILKKRLTDSVKALVKRAEEPGEKEERAEEQVKTEKPEKKKEVKAKAPGKRKEKKAAKDVRKGVLKEIRKVREDEAEERADEVKTSKRPFTGIFKRIKEKEFSEKEIDGFFSEVETGLLQANIALEAIDFMKAGLKETLAGKPVKRGEAKKIIEGSFERLILEIVDQGKIDIGKIIDDSAKRKVPACFVFLGYNGSGKTTTIAKIANLLIKQKYKPVLAAADTFRAASIEQLEVHGKKLDLKVIKHKYGADPAAVIFDAKKHAQSKGLDVVLADTAGRMHTNVNLMDELKKVVRVNEPDLKILVVDSLTGNDVIEQVKKFDGEIGIDCVVLTKTDVNEKGGSIISACHVSKKPVLFLGTGQEYDRLELFEPKRFVRSILESE